MLAAIYRQAYVPGLCAAGAALVCGGVLAVATGSPTDTSSGARLAGMLWVVALAAVVALLRPRWRGPTALSAVVVEVLALLSAAALYGAARGSVLAGLAAAATVILFALAVLGTVVRASEPTGV